MMNYLIVMRDHTGAWHAVASATTWDEAYAAFTTMIATLAILDYYGDFPPTVCKIISYSETDYEKADALKCEP